MTSFCKYFILLFLGSYSFICAFSQNDSTQNKKHEISFGMPMFPMLYNDVEPGYFTDITNPPSLHLHMMRSRIFVPLNISYKILIRNKNKIRIGVSFTKVPNPYDFNTQHYLINVGIEHKSNKSSKFDFAWGSDLVFGHLEYHEYFWTSGHNNIGTIQEAVILLAGADVGISMQYNFTQRLFMQNETTIMAYIGSGNGIVLDYSTNPAQNKSVGVGGLGIIFSKLIGISIGYKI